MSVCSGFAMLTLHKDLSESRHGGNATIDDFTLSASMGDGPSVSLLSGQVGRLGGSAGGHVHARGDGRSPATTSSVLASSARTQQSGFSVTLALGDNIDCTITNEDVPVDLELTKDDGGFVGTAGVQTPFTYTITVENVGPRELDNEPVTVVDDLPDGVRVGRAGSVRLLIAGQKLTCDVSPASLRPAGTTVTINATARSQGRRYRRHVRQPCLRHHTGRRADHAAPLH